MSEISRSMGRLPMKQSTKWYLRMFYAMALIPPALAVELLAQSSTAAAAVSALMAISLMVSAVIYCWAMFMDFHHPLYHQALDSSMRGISAVHYILGKLAAAVLWLLAFTAATAVLLFLHSSLLHRMPQEVMDAEILQAGVSFISENFGTGAYLAFSAISLLLQAIVLISITYAAAAFSHLYFCRAYKPLAGVFLFLLLYFFENDFATVLKRLLMGSLGGIEALVSQDLKKAMGPITGIEFVAYAAIILVNAAITCYFLKRTQRGELEWKS